MILLSSKHEPAIWSCHTGRLISCFNDAVQRCRRFSSGRAHVPANHATSHVDHEKSSMGFYFYVCIWLCSYMYSYGGPLGSPMELRYYYTVDMVENVKKISENGVLCSLGALLVLGVCYFM